MAAKISSLKPRNWQELAAPRSSLGRPAPRVEGHDLTHEIVFDREPGPVVAEDGPMLKPICLRSPDDDHLVLARVQLIGHHSVHAVRCDRLFRLTVNRGGWVGLDSTSSPQVALATLGQHDQDPCKKTHLGEQNLVVRLQLERHDGGAGRPASRQLPKHLGHLFEIQAQRLIARDLVLGLRRVRVGPSVCVLGNSAQFTASAGRGRCGRAPAGSPTVPRLTMRSQGM